MKSLIVLISIFAFTQSQTTRNLVSSNSRAMGLGGAFMSIADVNNSILWNPAMNIISKNREHSPHRQFGLFDVDLGPAIIMAGGLTLHAIFGEDCSCADDEEACKERQKGGPLEVAARALPYAFRGGSYYGERFYIQLKLNEELVDYDFGDKFDPYDNSQNILSFAYQIGREWAIGYSQVYYVIGLSEDDALTGFGNNIGVAYNALRVKGLSYGLSYFNFPNNMRFVRSGSERLFDKTFNFGISYKDDPLLIALDVRNVFDDSKGAHQELHFGLEYAFLRFGGYFVENDTEKFVPTIGLGYQGNSIGSAEQFFSISFSYSYNKHLNLDDALTLSAQINF